MPSNHLILCSPCLLLSSIIPSIRVFSNKLTLCIRWPKDWSFSFSISKSNEYSGLISFRIDWFDLLAVQATLKSLLQHHSSKASILWLSAFFRNSHGGWTCLAQHKRQPECPVVTRESRRNSRKTTWLPRHRKMKPFPAKIGRAHV